MKRIYAVLLVSLSVLVCLFASCISREAAEQNMPQENVQQGYCTVTFYDGQAVVQQLTVRSGGRLQDYPRDYQWRDENGDLVDVGSLTVTGDMRFYAAGKVALLTNHVRYMSEQSQQFRPDEYVTRGQTAQIVSALIVPDTAAAAGSTGGFSDVPAGSQYYDAVQTVAAMELMNGYSDGTFRPDATITRGELLTVICRLTGTTEVQALAFPDVTAEHWTLGSVAAAMTKGWVKGYEDGSFYPDYPVTRAEAAVLVNRALGRTPNKTAIDAVFRKSPYTDVHRWDWAYYDIVDVSVENELLSYIMGEVEGVRPGFVIIEDQMCHVNAELKLDYFEMGFHRVEDGLESDGVYYVPENGYFVQRNEPGLQEFDGDLFYVPFTDGPFVCDYDLGYLHFGENGRYTSGDLEVDAYVNTIMKPIIMDDSNNLLNEAKLREAYNAIVYGGYGYMRRYPWSRGTTKWTLEAAKVMYETKRGSCFYWAASFMYLARRLGFQAYPVCGGVGTNNQLHAWVMIDDDAGNEYIYDVELDWAYRTNYYHNDVGAMDMFKQLRGHAHNVYIFPGDTYSAPPSDEDFLTEETPSIVWPSSVNGNAYIQIGEEIIPLSTTWTPLQDVNGNVIGYTVMAEYNGMTYSFTYTLDTPVPPSQTEQPGATTDPWGDPWYNPDDPMWTDPNGGDPNDPNTGDPNDPNTGDPNDPNTGDPNDPNTGDPNDPNTGDPNDPNTGDPNNPGGSTGGEGTGGTGGEGTGGNTGDSGSTGGNTGDGGSSGGEGTGDGGGTGGSTDPGTGGGTGSETPGGGGTNPGTSSGGTGGDTGGGGAGGDTSGGGTGGDTGAITPASLPLIPVSAQG